VVSACNLELVSNRRRGELLQEGLTERLAQKAMGGPVSPDNRNLACFRTPTVTWPRWFRGLGARRGRPERCSHLRLSETSWSGLLR
jgi:hypothetical protein